MFFLKKVVKSVLFSVTLINVARVAAQTDSLLMNITAQIDSGDHYIYSDNKRAAEFYTLAQDQTIGTNNDSLLARTYVGFAIIARLRGDFTKSLQFHQKSLDIHIALQQGRFIATDYHNIGVLYRKVGDLTASKDFLLKGMHLRSELKDSVELCISYNQVGVAYRKLGQIDSAAYFYQKAYDLAVQRNDQVNIVHVNGNLATLDYSQENYYKAIERNIRDLPYLESVKQNASLATRNYMIAQSYRKLQHYEKSIFYLNAAIDIGEKERYLENLSRYYKARSFAYNRIENYELALEDYRKFRKYKDTVFNIEKTKEFTEQQLSFEYQKLQLADSLQFAGEQEQLSLIAQSERSKKNFFLLLVFLLAILIMITWFFLKSKRKLAEVKLEKQELEAELLEKKLQNTEKEAERIVAEHHIQLEQKKALGAQLQALSKASKDPKVIKTLKTLALDVNLQVQQEGQHLLLGDSRDQYNIAFEERLIELYPSLTKSERELCILIRLNKSSKEIVELKGVTAPSVRSMRYRVRKKMKLPREMELAQILRTI